MEKIEKKVFRPRASANRWQPPFSGRIAKFAVAGALIAYCLMGLLRLIQESSFLFRLHDAGHGDSYILYDVLHFQKTGHIYRDLSQPPYLPAQYSPSVYILYSIPGLIVTLENPFVGPRLVALAAVLVCIGIVTSIVHTFIPLRFTWVWGMLLASSIGSMWAWPLQIRGDFPGICFSLLAIRLLLSRSRWASPLAGICAGLAIGFKFTFVAASIAGALWLLGRRQWKDLAKFATLAIICSAGLYIVYSLREPRMLSQMLALSPGILDVRGSLRIMYKVASELVVLLAVLGLPPIAWRIGPRGTLVLLFSTTSFAIAGLTALHAGANVNYYFEALFAVIPIATLGVLRLVALARRNPMFGFFLTCLLGVYVLVPRAVYLWEQIKYRDSRIEAENKTFLKLERALRGHRIFSTVPRFALLDPNPPLVEPYLLSYLHLLGKQDPKPILDSIRNGEYDVALTAVTPRSWRGIFHIEPGLHGAIADSYRPQCAIQGWLLHLPARPHPDSSALAQDLLDIGCVAVPPATNPDW